VLSKRASREEGQAQVLDEEAVFWKLRRSGDYIWVAALHSGFVVREQPEYVFALQQPSRATGCSFRST